jgi:hypothetical protein
MDDYEASERTCDICGDQLNPLDYRVNWLREMDFCATCDISNMKIKVENYDRRNMTIEEKPHKWNCYKCNKSLGGGCNWYLIICNEYHDACEDCYAKYGTTDFRKDMSVGTYHNPCPLEGEPDFELVIPNGINPDDLQPLDNETIRRLNCDDFGYLSQWKMLSGWYDIPHYSAGVNLIIDCSPLNSGRVCSIAYDNHGRLSFDIAYDNVDDYLAAKSSWKCPTNMDENLKKIQELTNAKADDDEIDKLTMRTNFSAYVRLSKNLELYFG